MGLLPPRRRIRRANRRKKDLRHPQNIKKIRIPSQHPPRKDKNIDGNKPKSQPEQK